MKLVDLDEVIDAIESTDWYHINNRGELSEGAEGDESALYKAEDVYKAIKEVPVVDAVPIEVIERYREKLIQHRDTLPQHTMRWMMVDEDICVVDEILKYSQKGDDDGTD